MSRSSPESETIQTGDMTMAVFLIMKGLKPELRRTGETDKGHPVGAWEFKADAYTRALISDYAIGDAVVEPREFHRALTSARKDMFRFLGIGD